AVRAPFQTALQTILNRAWKVATDENAQHDPIVGPPIYGCWQAARHVVNVAAPPPLNWLDELNLDPRQRVVAAFGAQVVQAEQEDLMASAWEQLGEIQRVNQIRRQGQLGRAVCAVYHSRHFSQFSQDTLLKVLAPAQSRLVVEPTTPTDKRALLSQKILLSAVPSTAISALFGRLTNPRGIVTARFVTRGAPPIAPMLFMARFSTAATVALVTQSETGPINFNQVSENPTAANGALKDTVRSERILQS